MSTRHWGHQMASIERRLPPEILTNAFKFLAYSQSTISACRLVCRSFNGCASEFLVTRVIIAKRIDVIRRLWEVLEHPYFRQHVTELVYDASTWDEETAMDFEHYTIAAGLSSRDAFFDEEDAQSCAAYARLYQHVCPLEPWSGVATACEPWQTTGLHKGFYTYSRRWLSQTQMAKDGLVSRCLDEALSRFPKLQKISFTDYRVQAADGESYSSLCRRLFGNAVEPRASVFHRDDFLTLLRSIKNNSPPNLCCLKVEKSPYESVRRFWDTYTSDRTFIHHSSDPVALSHTTERCEVDLALTKYLFSTLRELRLSLTFEHTYLDCDLTQTFLGAVLNVSMPNLIDFSLYAVNLLKIEKGGRLCIRHPIGKQMESFLLGLRFRKLQHLELGGWPLGEASEFNKFLFAHSPTLQTLRLSNCLIPEIHDMSLRGLEVSYC